MLVAIDSYSEANQDGDGSLRLGGTKGRGQSFTGDGEVLESAKFYLKKTGSPTGNAVAKIYAHSGTYGTSSLPTGAALATSDNFDVSTLTTSYQLTTLTFTGANKITLTDEANYVVTIEYNGGDGSNRVEVGHDASSPTHAGNYVYQSTGGSWFALNTWDCCFYVYKKVPAKVLSLMGVG